MGRKTKYDENTFPLLAEKYARMDMIDKEIANKLGISTAVFYDYQNKFPEFEDAIKRGKMPTDIKVENSGLKRALGYDYEEVTTEVKVNDDGTTKPISIKKVKKHVPADPRMIEFWLSNRNPGEWKSRNSGLTKKKDY